MALALLLRSVPKGQVGSLLPKHVLNTSVAIITDSNHKCHSMFTQNKTVSLMPTPKILVAPHVRHMSGDHSKLWVIEKAVSVGLLFIVPAAIAAPNVMFDNLLAVASVIHFHWGLEAVVEDYARPIVIGNILPKLVMGLLYLISATTLGALLYFNMTDIGVGKTIRQFWSIKNQ